MTMIVAWRDPFCILSDDRQTGALYGAQSSIGPKMEPLSGTLVLGFAGCSDDYKGLVGAVRALPARDWDTFEEDSRAIVDKLNENTSWRCQATIVVAGTIGDQRGIFDSVGPMRLATTRRYAFAGSGGIFAGAAKALATRFCAEEVLGEDLLKTVVEAGVDADEHSGKPIHRTDLGDPLQSYQWLK